MDEAQETKVLTPELIAKAAAEDELKIASKLETPTLLAEVRRRGFEVIAAVRLEQLEAIEKEYWAAQGT